GRRSARIRSTRQRPSPCDQAYLTVPRALRPPGLRLDYHGGKAWAATLEPRTMTRGSVAVLLVSLLFLAEPETVAAEWAVKPGAGAGCALESSPESLPDGYQTTTARLRVDGKTVTVSSPST